MKLARFARKSVQNVLLVADEYRFSGKENDEHECITNSIGQDMGRSTKTNERSGMSIVGKNMVQASQIISQAQINNNYGR